MSEDAPPEGRDDAQELQDLRQFFYQCPVGLFEVDDDGLVLKVNPAAVAMLAPALGHGNLAKLFPVLDPLAPQVSEVISQDRDRMGPLAAGERILIPAEVHGTSALEVRAVRVAAGRVMVVLFDVSAERRLAAERDRLMGAEKAAHAEAEAARERAVAVSRQEKAARLRLQALQAVTAGLATAVTAEQVAGVVTGQGMSLVAMHGAVAWLDPGSNVLRTRATSSIPDSIGRAYAQVPLSQAGDIPLGQAVLTGKKVILSSRGEITARFPQTMHTHETTGTASLLTVPVLAGGRILGALAFSFASEGMPGEDVVSIAETLADLTAQALERASLYEAELAAAHQLQQALMPKIPARLPGVDIGACYRPAEQGHDVGGDWYDIFELPTGRIGFAVGDVVGHDLEAAVAMGRLQQLLRYVAMSGACPAEVLQALNDACSTVTGTDFATLGYAEYDPAEAVITYACAGHPPLLLVADGHAAYLNEGRSGPLGFQDGPRSQARLSVPSGTMLVWYSDGLIERRGEVVDRGLDRLAALAASLTGTDPQHWCQSLLTGMTDGQLISDDIVIACLHLRREPARMLPG
jgi:serine phosphatase RsbU (regulator of sigma subunit)